MQRKISMQRTEWYPMIRFNLIRIGLYEYKCGRLKKCFFGMAKNLCIMDSFVMPAQIVSGAASCCKITTPLKN